MLKNKIKNIGRISPSKFTEDELSEIYERTLFLKNVKLNERCYNILHNITSVTTCKECRANKTKFTRISIGYRDFCSNSCKNKWIIDNTNIKEKISQSVSEYHNMLSPDERIIQQDKRLKTMIVRNIMSHPNDRSDFYNYSKMVWRYTNRNNLSELKNYDKRGRVEVNGSFHLDHKYSIYQGFQDKILPFYIGNIQNLEMIPSKENVKKKQKCSIVKEELFV